MIFSTPFVELTNLQVLPTPFPFTYPPKNVSAKNPDTTFNWSSVEPISGSALYNVHNTVPYLESYFFGVQREVAKNTVITANYVGTQGRHQLTSQEANPGNPGLCLSLNAAALAPGQTPCGPYGESNAYTLANGTVVNGTRQAFGLALGSNGYMSTVATSNYNSLQVSFKHSTELLDVLLGYTYGRSFDNGSGLTDATNPLNPERSYGLSNYDFTQYFVGSYTIHSPFDKFVDGWKKQVVGGWAVSGITKFATGTAVTISENDDRSLIGTGGVDLPNYTAGKLAGNHNPRKNQPYFNTALFTQEPLGQVGSSERRFFHGPGLDNTDLALLRNFHIHESQTAQFRAEAFNVFNHAQFNNPNGNWNNTSIFGVVTSANAPRIMQIAVKYTF